MTASEQKLLDYAQNAEMVGEGACYEFDAKGDYAKIPCELAPLTRLARLASLDNRHAQLELGKRFEAGRGVARDWDRAEELYLEAGKNRGGPIWVYVPGVGDSPGRVQQLNTPVIPGLMEANVRLGDLRARRANSQ